MDTNEETGDWFPPPETSLKACSKNHCKVTEQPMLLDPVKQGDVRLIDVQDMGELPRGGSPGPEASASRQALD